MAVPRLANIKPFYLLDPTNLPEPIEVAATSEVAARIARMIDTDEMVSIDLIVSGSVAVDHDGRRIGKGAGYADIEVALLSEASLVGEWTTFATTVHDHQLVDFDLPPVEHDFAVDLVVTPFRTERNERRPRRFRIVSHSADPRIEEIPLLRARLHVNY